MTSDRSLDRARFDRRTMLAAALATGGGAILAAASRGDRAGAAMAQFAARTKPAGSDLGAIEHVVFLMQENRAFDHYFGAMPGVRGFGDSQAIPGVFKQADPLNPDAYLYPFHADTQSTSAQNLPSTSHSWGPQHGSWNNGAMDGFVTSRITDVAVGSSISPTSTPARNGERPKYGPLVEKIGMNPKCAVRNRTDAATSSTFSDTAEAVIFTSSP